MIIESPPRQSIGSAQAFTQIIEAIEIDLDACTASVEGHAVKASSLSELRAELTSAIYLKLHTRYTGDSAEVLAPKKHMDLAEKIIAEIPHRTVLQATSEVGGQMSVNGVAHRSVQLNGVKVLAPTEDTMLDHTGQIVGVRMPSWRERTTPGYVLALGQHPIRDPQGLARFYIACDRAANALLLWPELLQRLDATGAGYHAKTLADSALFPRGDAVVVYTSQADTEIVAAAVLEALAQVPEKDLPVSLFARPLAPSVALAEEPIDARPSYAGLSFGQHRSRVLAEALIQAKRSGQLAFEAWAELARQASINPHMPGFNTPR